MTLIYICSILLVYGQGGGVEICNNGLDDDADGLVDLNDPDCECQVFEPVSLIPNPSFEESECCPQNRSSLHCAETWIQASAATTDYLHTCGWMGWPNLAPPLPFPDGQACIGFRDGRFGMDESNANWKEYTGACLTEPLRAGNTYRFEFYVGFTNARSSPPLTMAFFGSSNCDNLPFGGGDDTHGCPLNGPGWTQLDQTPVWGANTWKKEVFEVTPSTDLYAIAIGPGCRERTSGPNPYYFLDDLLLADVREFEFVIRADSNSCADDFTLFLPHRDSLQYQWYRNGIALPNESAAVLSEDIQDGTYQVQIMGEQFCRLTKPFHFSRPEFTNVQTVPLCPDAMVDFLGTSLATSGLYMDTLTSVQGCDSIVVLDLFDASHVASTHAARIFPGETLMVGQFGFTEPTQEFVTLVSSHGCDSVVDLTVDYFQVFIPNGFSPNGDGLNDQFEILGDSDLIAVSQLTIFDRWGVVLHRSDPTSDANQVWDGHFQGQPAPPGAYLFMAEALMNDGQSRRLSGTVNLMR